MKPLKLKFHSDAGHGWLAVKRELLNLLGIADKVTSYSYQRGQSVYLEEDCDASLLIKALDARCVAHTIVNIKPKNRSPIRSYASYKSPTHQAA